MYIYIYIFTHLFVTVSWWVEVVLIIKCICHAFRVHKISAGKIWFLNNKIIEWRHIQLSYICICLQTVSERLLFVKQSVDKCR